MASPDRTSSGTTNESREAAQVRTLYDQCQANERQWTKSAIERIKDDIALLLTFHGELFDTFSKQKTGPETPESELAARYRAFHRVLKSAKGEDDRLWAFAVWMWAELDIRPEQSIGKAATVELISREQKRLARIPFNDFRYAGIVRSWLPYADRLFQERKDIRRGLDASTRLKNMRYDPLAIEIVLTKRWRSAVEFVCGWLAQRGGIEMVKQRKDSDSANTLRNSYTRVFGQKSTSSGH